MILPSGGFLTLSAWLLLFNWLEQFKERKGKSDDSTHTHARARWLCDERANPLWSIFVNACLVNNFVLAYFLGICPFLGVSVQASHRHAYGRCGDVRHAG